HLIQLKHFRHAHNLPGMRGTAQGELIVECPTCPHPDKNLLANWKDAAPSMRYIYLINLVLRAIDLASSRWLYTLFLMMDANFQA
ncbi:hypothetical protein LXA43DRAFT_895865, partial [Ganoderma leucocontextum]